MTISASNRVLFNVLFMIVSFSLLEFYALLYYNYDKKSVAAATQNEKMFQEITAMDVGHRAVLQKSTLFQDMSNEDYESLINCLSPIVKTFTKNEIILMSGETIKHIGIFLEGRASAYYEHVDGSRTLVTNLSPMSVLGEILVNTKTQKSPVTVYAVSDVEIAFIEHHKVYSMCESACSKHRVFIQNILNTIGDKYFFLFDRVSILREKKLRSRIMAYLSSLKNKEGSTSITLPFSKTFLADYLMVNRSALSKELHNMVEDGVIKVNGRKIEIIDNEVFSA